MATVSNETAKNNAGAAGSESIKRTAVSWATGWLNRQETSTVVLILIGAVLVVGLVFIYRDMRADNREALAKQESARREYVEQLAAERARSDAHAEKTAASIEKFGDRMATSLDRLTEEIRRRPLSSN